MRSEDIKSILMRLTDVTSFDYPVESLTAFQKTIEEIERLLADEREKVREMCAHYLEVEADRDTIVEDELKPLGQTILKTAALHLRLLDLTKLDEGKGGKP